MHFLIWLVVTDITYHQKVPPTCVSTHLSAVLLCMHAYLSDGLPSMHMPHTCWPHASILAWTLVI